MRLENPRLITIFSCSYMISWKRMLKIHFAFCDCLKRVMFTFPTGSFIILKKMNPLFCLPGALPSSQYQNCLHLDNNEIPAAQDFIETTHLPLPPNYITLAHDNYEISYFIDNDSHAFLSLMISLEVLFKPKKYRNFSRTISDEAEYYLGNQVLKSISYEMRLLDSMINDQNWFTRENRLSTMLEKEMISKFSDNTSENPLKKLSG